MTPEEQIQAQIKTLTAVAESYKDNPTFAEQRKNTLAQVEELKQQLRSRRPIDAQLKMATEYAQRKEKAVQRTQTQIEELNATLKDQQRDLASARKRIAELKAKKADDLAR